MDLEGGGGGEDFHGRWVWAHFLNQLPQYHCKLIRGKYIFIFGGYLSHPTTFKSAILNKLLQTQSIGILRASILIFQSLLCISGVKSLEAPMSSFPFMSIQIRLHIHFNMQVYMYGSPVTHKSMMECRLLCVASNNGSPNCSGLPVYCQHYNPLKIRRCSIL